MIGKSKIPDKKLSIRPRVVRRRLARNSNGYEARPYNLPLAFSFQNEYGTYNSVHGLSVKINFGDYVGHGVSAPLSGYVKTGGFLNEVKIMNDIMNEFLDFTPTLRLRRNPVMVHPKFEAPINMAINDILTQILDQPFSYNLNRNVLPATHIPVTGLLPQMPFPNFTDEVIKTCQQGHASLKLKIGNAQSHDFGMEDDLARIQAVRNHAPDLPLSLDANGMYAPDVARKALKLFSPYNIDYIEEPVKGLDEMIKLTKDSPIEIAVDESCETMLDVDKVIGIDEIRTVILKPTRFSDIFSLFAKAQRMQQIGKRVVTSSAMDGDFGLATAVHFASMLDGAEENPAGLDTNKLYTSLATTSTTSVNNLRLLNGFMQVPTKPGLGVLDS